MPASNHPHGGQPVLRRGPSAANARVAVILVHGRGASAEDILGLSGEFAVDDVLYLAPQASDNTWYPFTFLSPIDRNEPGISSGMRVISELLNKLASDGMQPNRVVILGFSQGACLSLEFAARHAQRFAGVVALSGGLIGPPGTAWNYPGSLDATPVFLGCSDVDPHIPVERVRESADVFRRLGATVDERIYRGMGHTVNADEIDAINAMLAGDVARGTI